MVKNEQEKNMVSFNDFELFFTGTLLLVKKLDHTTHV
jgi:hypothetical protein